MTKICRGADILAKLPVHTAAYLAGLFDGEGCVTIGQAVGPKHTYWVLTVKIINTGIDFMRALYIETGSPGSFYIDRVRLRQEHRKVRATKPCAAWSMTRRTAAEFLLAIRPWVRLKRDCVETALYFWAICGGRPKQNLIGQGVLAYKLRQQNKTAGRARPLPGQVFQ